MAGIKFKDLDLKTKEYLVNKSDYEGLEYFLLEYDDPDRYKGTEIYKPWQDFIKAHRQIATIFNKYQEELEANGYQSY